MKIIVKRNDGGISIIHPTHEATLELLERDALSVDGYVTHQEIEDDAIPQDREFRNAWCCENGKIYHDMIKANEIKRDKLRVLRKPLLDKLDIDYMRADESGDLKLKQQIADKKQALRDITNFTDIKDIDDLKSFMPEMMKE